MTGSSPGSGAVTKQRLTVVSAEDSVADWDAFVKASDDASFCHHGAWREIMSGVLGHECLYRAAVDADGQWQGILPLVRVRSAIFGHYLVSMPFLNYGGPVGTETARSFLARDAVAEARRSGVRLLELRSRGEPAPGDLAVANRKVMVLLDLPDSEEALWRDGFRAKLRSQIRRAERSAPVWRCGVDQSRPFYEVFARHMRDLGTPVLPRAWFDAIASELADMVVFGVVYYGDTPVAAGCGFQWRDEFEITWAASLREYSREAPNMLLYWSFMKEMIRRGITVFNFGRCTPGGGTHRFKLQWGGRDEPLPWAQWSPAGVAATPSPDSLKYRLAGAVWQRIPLPVATRLGPRLARSLP